MSIATVVNTAVALARLASDIQKIWRSIDALRKGKNSDAKRDLADTLEAEARTLTAAYKRASRTRTRQVRRSKKRDRDSMGRYT